MVSVQSLNLGQTSVLSVIRQCLCEKRRSTVMLCFTLLYTIELINKLYFFQVFTTLTFLSVADEYHHGDDTKQDGGHHVNDFLFHASKIYIGYSRRGNTNKGVCAAWYKISTKSNYRKNDT